MACQCNQKPTPHKHAKLIKAWADGVEIQYLETESSNIWRDCFPKETHTPLFASSTTKFRIKPKALK